MDTFYFKYADDETWCLMKYTGQDRDVVLPDTHGGRPVTILADDLLKGHENVEHVHLPSGLRALGGFVFDGCIHLHELELPQTLQDIWQYAFVRSGIETIRIPGSVRRVIPFVFKDCHRLRRAECGQGVERIMAKAFEGCENLEQVIVPADTIVDENAFAGCPNVTLVRK